LGVSRKKDMGVLRRELALPISSSSVDNVTVRDHVMLFGMESLVASEVGLVLS
jgi:hypothetical protein